MSATTSDLLSNGQRYYLPVYRPREVILERGQGARVWDSEGCEYVDLSAGIAVCGLGHNDPDLVAALTEQAGKLWQQVYEAIGVAAQPVCSCPRYLADQIFFRKAGETVRRFLK